jgi:diguanylate cyclase (GGDEF)-like protein
MCVGAVIVIKDITELKKAEERIKHQNNFLTSVINSLPHPFYVIDAATYQVQMANTAAHSDPLPENATCHMLSHNQALPCSSKEHPCPFEIVKKTGKAVSVEHVHLDAKGKKREVEVHCYPVFDSSGDIIQFIENNVDISERKLFEQMAFFDTLTGLPNRTLFFDRLDHAISLAKRNRQTLALLFLDLDRLKIVNDNFGHNAGDLLLKEIGARLKNCLRQSDTVARMGGDEFTIILTPITNPQDAGIFARKMLKIVAEPCSISGHEFIISGSVGISLYPEDGDNAEILLQKADIAMYRSKEQRNNIFRFYTSAYNEND